VFPIGNKKRLVLLMYLTTLNLEENRKQSLNRYLISYLPLILLFALLSTLYTPFERQDVNSVAP